MAALFWVSVLFVAYVYVGYPLLLRAWAAIRSPRAIPPVGTPPTTERPTVSIILAARNEGHRLAARIENLRQLDYPSRPQVIVVSDGSTDNTAWALAAFHDIDVLMLPPGGKAAALNAGVSAAVGEILAFADARQTFDPQALNALVARFDDPGVGVVSGELVLGCEPGSGRRRIADRRVATGRTSLVHDRRQHARRRDHTSQIAEGVRRYWGYEKELRRLESVVGSMVGATGAIYAMRRTLWQPLPAGTILDDVLAPMRAALSGARLVFEPRAQAYDSTAADASAEGRRKIRTLSGNFQILWLEPRLLIPFVNPVWLQYLSHKIGRLLVPYALLGILISSLALAPASVFYRTVLIAQCAFYLEALYGWWLAQERNLGSARPSIPQRAGAIAFAFMVMNAAAVAGLGAAMFSRRTWR